MKKTSFKISLLTALVLLHNLYLTKDKDIDADNLFEELLIKLTKHQVNISTDDLEGFLAFCNYNSEDGTFFHPSNITFDTFVKRTLGKGYKFDKFYNLIEGTNG